MVFDKMSDFLRFIKYGIVKKYIEPIPNNKKLNTETKSVLKDLKRVITPEQFRNGSDI
jgi:hypothetical protein